MMEHSIISFVLLMEIGFNGPPSCQTPLWVAIKEDHSNIAQLLLSNNADVNKAGNGGRTPLWMASWWGRSVFAELLLANKADVNKADKYDQTPLYIAIQQENSDVAQLLLANNADVNKANDDGETPLWLASKEGFSDVAELLVANNADFNMANNDGKLQLFEKTTGDINCCPRFFSVIVPRGGRMGTVSPYPRDSSTLYPSNLGLGLTSREMADLAKKCHDYGHVTLYVILLARNPVHVCMKHESMNGIPRTDKDSPIFFTNNNFFDNNNDNINDKICNKNNNENSNNNSQTPLKIAREFNQQDVVKVLEAAGANE
ncbi:unnamed protein product, partial [Meganyctiphanes norvegica]